MLTGSRDLLGNDKATAKTEEIVTQRLLPSCIFI